MKANWLQLLILAGCLQPVCPNILKSQHRDLDTFDTTGCEVSLNLLWDHCFACPGKSSHCTITKVGFLGEALGKKYYYGLYRRRIPPNQIVSSDSEATVMIFESQEDTTSVRRIWELGSPFGVYSFDIPELVNTQYGPILHIPMSSGNEGIDDGFYYLRRNHAWIPLGCPYFYTSPDVDKSIPLGYYLSDVFHVNLEQMSIMAYVFKPDDSPHSPTGGSVVGVLTIEDDNSFAVKQIHYVPDDN